ncbi:putative carbonyl reductase [Mycena rosella]|uniref:Carbonyl reductase n=1 Tax=Mycena rosella TaxID=1033263 RepID=A0AAD7D272_MYCRO|nr:putative carbonyl reductase [Mycena rosella]
MASISKIVLITGANKGIGFEIAKQLASQYKGYHILMGSRAAEALKKEGLSVEALTIDVADDRSIEAAAQTVKSKFGHLDVLINNAGISLDSFTGQPSTRAIFEQTFAVNLFGAASTTEAFIPLLEKSTAARLVFVSSDLGSLSFLADPEGRHNSVLVPAYRCSKAAMNMLALTYAQRFRTQGWKVNIHNPGYTATDLNRHTGPGTVEDAAKGAVRLATLGEDGDTGTYSEKEGPLPW